MDIDNQVKKSQDDFVESLRNLENNNDIIEENNNFNRNICIFISLICISIGIYFIYNIYY